MCNLNKINRALKLELLDKLILPIINYGAKVWGLCKALPAERLRL